jgi:hypothetical protein
MLRGEVPPQIRPTLYGANLHAFRKKDGGIRPIAVGMTLRRLISRVVSTRSRHLRSVLNPLQLGFATKGGAEAAVHAVRSFAEHSSASSATQVLLKLDIKNAFNSLDRNKVLEVASCQMPEYFPFIWQCYSQPTNLLYGDSVISSQCGVQQGDPLGPLLYCLATIDFHRHLQSVLVECYLDDDVLGGDPEAVLSDALVIQREAKKCGLELNVAKCEVTLFGGSEADQLSTMEKFLEKFPEISRPLVEDLYYLGAPLTIEATPTAIIKATSSAQSLTNRLSILPSHQALYLLTNCLGPVKLLYTLRTSRAYNFPGLLSSFDEIIRDSLCSICNTDIVSSIWTQASLPISLGGLGIRRAEELALPAFIASVYSVHDTISNIIQFSIDNYLESSVSKWSVAARCSPPVPETRGIQKAWDAPLTRQSQAAVLSLASGDPNNTARLLAASTKESGAWLRALPAASIGNLLDDSCLRIAVALRLGAPITVPHQCVCSALVDSRGYHGLSCKFSAGRRSRHAGINLIIKRALASAGYCSQLEPTGISRADGKRPDGVTLSPWSQGRCLCWDATIVCTLAISHVARSVNQPGSASEAAESKKISKYQDLSPNYLFSPLGFETLGPWGPEAKKFLTKVGRLISKATGEPRATAFLAQRISLEVQRGNAASVLGTAPKREDFHPILEVSSGRRQY